MSKEKQPQRLTGQKVRIKADAVVLSQHEAGPTAPERVSVRIGGIITIVPVRNVEIVQ